MRIISKPKNRLLPRWTPYSHQLRSSTRSSDMAAASHRPVADQVPGVHRHLRPVARTSPPLLRPQPIRPPLPHHVTSAAAARTPAVAAAAHPSFAGLPTTSLAPFCNSPAGVRQLIVGAATTSGVGGRVDGTRRCSAFCPYSRGVGISDVTAPPLASSDSEVGIYSDEAAAAPLDLSCRGREDGRRTEARSPYHNHGAPPPPRPATVHRERFGTPTTTRRYSDRGRDSVHRRHSVHGPRSLSAGHVPLPATSDSPLPGRLMPVAVNSGDQLALPFRDDCSYCTGDSELPANGEHCTYDMSLSYGWARHVLGLPQSPLFGPRQPRLFSVTCSNCSHKTLLRLS